MFALVKFKPVPASFNDIKNTGVSPSGKATGSDPVIPVFESQYPSHVATSVLTVVLFYKTTNQNTCCSFFIIRQIFFKFIILCDTLLYKNFFYFITSFDKFFVFLVLHLLIY